MNRNRSILTLALALAACGGGTKLSSMKAKSIELLADFPPDSGQWGALILRDDACSSAPSDLKADMDGTSLTLGANGGAAPLDGNGCNDITFQIASPPPSEPTTTFTISDSSDKLVLSVENVLAFPAVTLREGTTLHPGESFHLDATGQRSGEFIDNALVVQSDGTSVALNAGASGDPFELPADEPTGNVQIIPAMSAHPVGTVTGDATADQNQVNLQGPAIAVTIAP